MDDNIIELAKKTPLPPLRLPIGLFISPFAVTIAIAAAIEKEGLYGKVDDMAITPNPVLPSVPRLFEFRFKRPAKDVV